MQNIGLAAEIERDLLGRNDTSSRHAITACHACGYTYIDRGSICCSSRCAQWLAEGNPPHDPHFARKCIDLPPPEPPGIPMRSWKVIAGPPGSRIGESYYGPILDHYWQLRAQREAKEKRSRKLEAVA